MVTPHEALESLRDEPNVLLRHLKAVSIISERMARQGEPPVVVGGLAVEAYTVGSYMTRDIDLFTALPFEAIDETMKELGFVREHGVWKYPGLGLIVDFPAGPLEADRERIVELDVEGRTVRLISLEDIVLDRVKAAKHWNDLASEEWAANLMAAHYEDIDWDYCHREAARADCLDKFEEIQRFVKKQLRE